MTNQKKKLLKPTSNSRLKQQIGYFIKKTSMYWGNILSYLCSTESVEQRIYVQLANNIFLPIVDIFASIRFDKNCL